MELTRSNTFEHVLFRSAESLKHPNIEEKKLKIENKNATVSGLLNC